MLNFSSSKLLTFSKRAALALLFLWLYRSAHRYMLGQWQSEDFTYCFVMPFVILYLLWERRRVLRDIDASPSWTGIPVLLAGLFLYWAGELGGEFYTLFFSSWLVLVGLLWVGLGWQKIRAMAFPLLLIPAMFPFPSFLHTKISFYLKILSSKLGVALLHLFGITALREGNVIDMGFTQLQVVDACSGLRYLIPLFIMGLLFAYFYRAPMWKRAALALSSVPIAVAANSLRIALTGVLYPAMGPAVAEGFFHDFSAVFIYGVSLGAMGVLRVGMGRWGKVSGFSVQCSGKGEDGRGEKAEVEKFKRLEDQLEDRGRREGAGLKPETRNLKPSSLAFLEPRFLAVLVLLGGTLWVSSAVDFRERVPIAKALEGLPLRIGSWQGVRRAMDPKYLGQLSFSDYAIVDFYDGPKKLVNLYVAYYETQRKGESIHSPETCLPGSGWAFSQAGVKQVPAANGSDRMDVNRAYMERGQERMLAYYWFPARGRVITNLYEMKLFTFWDALTRQRTDGALVRLITPILPGEALDEADKRLESFTQQIVPVLWTFMPS